jgi:hypothetical protein
MNNHELTRNILEINKTYIGIFIEADKTFKAKVYPCGKITIPFFVNSNTDCLGIFLKALPEIEEYIFDVTRET